MADQPRQPHRRCDGDASRSSSAQPSSLTTPQIYFYVHISHPLVQIAGSDTSYSTLVHIFYYLAIHPQLQSQLHAEVSPTLSSNSLPKWPALSTAPLLDAIITETLRMHPPISMGLTRETPILPSSQPTKIGPYLVPGETMLSIPTWTIQHDERYFEKPHDWAPERWTSRPEMVKDRRAYLPFSMGRTVCAGKYFAIMEMKVVVAKVVGAFEIGFPKGEGEKEGRNGKKGDPEWLKGNKDFFTLWLPELRLCLVPRGKEVIG
jgi:cytochrome P450 family 628